MTPREVRLNRFRALLRPRPRPCFGGALVDQVCLGNILHMAHTSLNVIQHLLSSWASMPSFALGRRYDGHRGAPRHTLMSHLNKSFSTWRGEASLVPSGPQQLHRTSHPFSIRRGRCFLRLLFLVHNPPKIWIRPLFISKTALFQISGSNAASVGPRVIRLTFCSDGGRLDIASAFPWATPARCCT